MDGWMDVSFLFRNGILKNMKMWDVKQENTQLVVLRALGAFCQLLTDCLARSGTALCSHQQ